MNMGLEDYDLHAAPSQPQTVLPADYLPEYGSLKSLNLDSELYAAYARAKNYLAIVQADEEIPPNQISQVMNTLTAILDKIVKLQTELYNAERVKKLEAAMIQAIKLAPPESQQVFLEQYQTLLKAAE
jgi:hypothetical protein